MAYESIAKYSLLFHKLWELRDDYVGALRQDPIFLKQDLIRRRLRCRHPWKAIDEREALPLIRDAVNWMKNRVPMLQFIVNPLWSAGLRCIGRSKTERRRILQMAYRDIEKTREYVELSSLVEVAGGSSCQVIRKLIALSEGAAAIVVLFLVGMRVSELLSLDINSVRKKLHSDGHAFQYLRGVAAKKKGRSRDWVASPEVIDALNKMNSLFAGPRAYSNKEHTFISYCGTNGYPLPGRKISQMYSGTISKKMKVFANAKFRDNAPLTARLHPHAARKTFARFVVLRDKRALGALAHHYGHTHRIYTDTNYIGSDIELATMISEENRRDLAVGLTDILQSSNLSGKASGLLRAAVTNETQSRPLRGRKVIAKLAERLIDEGVTLAPCDWGYCVYSQAFSACRGDAIGPNLVERAPDVCGKCSNFVVTNVHRSWWEDRFRDASHFLSRSGLSAQSVAVVTRRREVAEGILRKLNLTQQTADDDEGK